MHKRVMQELKIGYITIHGFNNKCEEYKNVGNNNWHVTYQKIGSTKFRTILCDSLCAVDLAIRKDIRETGHGS